MKLSSLDVRTGLAMNRIDAREFLTALILAFVSITIVVGVSAAPAEAVWNSASISFLFSDSVLLP